MSDECPLHGCSSNCASYNVCSPNTGLCVANEVACPSNTINDQTSIGASPESGSPITNDVLQALKDVVDDEFSNAVRRYNIEWQPTAPTISEFLPETEINGGVLATDYWTAMANKLTEVGYGAGNVENRVGAIGDPDNYSEVNKISYTPNGDIDYLRDKIITGSMIIELYNAINMMVTDCVCYSNLCVCNQVCNCNSECSCHGHY